MKAKFLFPPVAALVLVGVWTGLQRSSIADVERETVILRDAIAAARNSAAQAEAAAISLPPRVKATDTKEPINWKELADEIAEMQPGKGLGGLGMETRMRLQQRLAEMEAGELFAALDEIAALEISMEARMMLESLLIVILARNSPQETLERFSDRLKDPEASTTWQLAGAMRAWSNEDPVAAGVWFDREIAAGTFESKTLDGESRSRLQFEAALVSSLLATDQGAAEKRVAALLSDERLKLLQQIATVQISVDPRKYAALVRASLDEKAVSETFAQAASSSVHRDGYKGVEKFMDETGLTPAERASAVERAAGANMQDLSRQGKLPREEIENMREWAARHAPGSPDKLTGRALAESAEQGDRNPFSENAAIALEYHLESGNDEVLGTFLDSHAARSNREEARGLLEHISDLELREKLSEQLK